MTNISSLVNHQPDRRLTEAGSHHLKFHEVTQARRIHNYIDSRHLQNVELQVQCNRLSHCCINVHHQLSGGVVQHPLDRHQGQEYDNQGHMTINISQEEHDRHVDDTKDIIFLDSHHDNGKEKLLNSLSNDLNYEVRSFYN